MTRIAELSKPSELTSTQLETTEGGFSDYSRFISQLLARIFYAATCSRIRVLQHTGYDEESGCFVYPKFAFDRTGQLHTLNDQGYFDQLKIIPAPDSNAIKLPPDPKADVAAILQEHWQAFGLNGDSRAWFPSSYFIFARNVPNPGYHPIPK